MELLKQGGRLGDILEAGQWRSPAFLQYMLRADIDELAAFDMIECFRYQLISSKNVILS